MRFGALLAVTLALAGSTALAQTVYVTGGKIHGAMLERGGAVFKGIPYAAPPVGDLRWRDPAPISRWSGVREATSFGPACTQLPSIISGTAPTKEDCLYLNIWTAEWPGKARKPVMVFFPGGGNFGGYASQPEYVSDSLARRGVVLVTVNYRVGAFGFFSHPALTRESPRHASGNQGILDQIAALKWVRQNIARFGGDPDNITIFGGSATGLDVVVLMSSPLAKGLFERVIAESAPLAVIDSLIGTTQTLTQAEKLGEALAARAGLPAGATAADLRKLSADKILKVTPDLFKSSSDYKMTELIKNFPHLGLVTDGYAVPRNPTEVFATGQEHPVPFIIGSNAREMVPGGRPPADMGAALDDIFGPLSARARALYVGERDPLYGMPATQLATDASFRCGSVAQAAWHSSAGNVAYQFEFAHATTGREVLGPMHGTEMPYVFGTIKQGLAGPIVNPPAKPNAVDTQVSDAMQLYWTNFAKTGDPNGPGLPAWPKFTPSSRAYIQFTSAGPVAKEGLRRPYCDLFIENVKRQMTK